MKMSKQLHFDVWQIYFWIVVCRNISHADVYLAFLFSLIIAERTKETFITIR